MLGRETRLPIDMTFDLPQSSSSVTDYAASLSKSLNKAYELARSKIDTAQQRQTENCNQRVHR